MSSDPKVKITINDQEIEVSQTMNLIDAAKQIGDEIPHYCFHSELSVAGNCRMCLVEVEGIPKPVAACNTKLQEGLKVKTNTDQIKEARKQVLEFILANHPLDCPVCDQAGDCGLQDYYMKFGQYESSFFENKVKKKKAIQIGPQIMLDSERCILCSRCVRFCDEITQTHELGIVNRGDHSELVLNEGSYLDNNYAGNTVDICPVGALTDKDFRFQVRAWYLKSTPSICPGCSTGCNIKIHHNDPRRHHKANHKRVIRLKPRTNLDVNRFWMCDKGRYAYSSIDSPNRLQSPMFQHDPIDWETAFEKIEDELKNKHQIDKICVLLSHQLSIEDLFCAQHFFKELGIHNITSNIPLLSLDHDDFLLTSDHTPNRNGADLLNLIHHELSLKNIVKKAKEGHFSLLFLNQMDLDLYISTEEIKDLLTHIPFIISIDTHLKPEIQQNSLVLPGTMYAEKDGFFVNKNLRLQKFNQAINPIGQSKPDWMIYSELAERLHMDFNPNLSSIRQSIASLFPVLAPIQNIDFPQDGVLLQKPKELSS